MDEQYGPKPRVARYDVVLTGAGISIDPPSEVPDGNELVRRTWARLIRDLPGEYIHILRPVTEAFGGSTRPQVPIYLEPLMEVLSVHVESWPILVSTYVDVSTTRFNGNHHMLASLGAQQITLNMDKLLEAAGASPHHLHGTWDEPESIITTVRQYSDGLPASLWASLVDALSNRNVLVLGYSGRDTDVMPALSSARPKVLHWIHRSPVGDSVFRLKADLGDAMTFYTGTAREVLEVLQRDQSGVPCHASPPPNLPDRYSEIPADQRLLATAGVAFDLGFYETTVHLLDSERFAGGDEIKRLKLLSRAYTRSGDPKTGFQMVCIPPRNLAALRYWHLCFGEIAAAFPRIGHPLIGEAINRVLSIHPRSRVPAKIRIAHRMQISGRLDRSREILHGVIDDPHIHRQIGVSGIVDALTIYADTLKLLGDYGGAMALAEQCMDKLAYANWLQRSLAQRRLVELAHVAGLSRIVTEEDEPPVLLSDLLAKLYMESRDSHHDPVRPRNREVAFWAAGCLADVYIEISNDEAKHWLETAQRLISNRSQMEVVYLLLIDAERARNWGDSGTSIEQAKRALKRARGLYVPSLVAELSLTQSIAADSLSDQVTRKLDRLHREFSRLQARSLAARTQLLLAVASHAPVDGLASHFQSSGWNREAEIARRSYDEIMGCSWPVIL